MHEDRSLDQERDLVSLIERLSGRNVDVATSCGLGRRDREAALATIEQAAELCSTEAADTPSNPIRAIRNSDGYE